MAWLPMYLIEQDLTLLNDWLNREPELAFLVSNGPDRWIAKETHNIFEDIGKQKFGPGGAFARPDYAEYVLWHIPSEPLPLLKGGNGPITMRFDKEDWQHDAHIEDPWSGWAEIRGEAISRMPYFGAGHPGIIRLEIDIAADGEIRMSSFGWIGNHYKIIGNGAGASTEKFWGKLRRIAKKTGTLIPRCNRPDGKKEVYAFPAAYTEIMAGRACSLNP